MAKRVLLVESLCHDGARQRVMGGSAQSERAAANGRYARSTVRRPGRAWSVATTAQTAAACPRRA